MAKKIVFYTKEELKVLNGLAKSKKPVNKALLEDFCKKYNRTYGSVALKVYSLRPKYAGKTTKRKNNKLFTRDTTLVPKNNTINKRSGEFKVPINSWSISQNDNKLYFVVKF